MVDKYIVKAMRYQTTDRLFFRDTKYTENLLNEKNDPQNRKSWEVFVVVFWLKSVINRAEISSGDWVAGGGGGHSILALLIRGL